MKNNRQVGRRIAGRVAGYGVLIALMSGALSACTLVVTPSQPTAPITSKQSTPPPSTNTVTTTAPTVDNTIVLNAAGISSLPFGTSEGDVLDLMTRALGAPAMTAQLGECEAAAGTWQEYAKFGNLTLRFGAQDESPNSPRSLGTWTYTSTQPPSPPLALDASIPFGLTLDELQAQYPNGPGMDWMGAWSVGDVWIVPGTSDYPETTVTAGDLDWCT